MLKPYHLFFSLLGNKMCGLHLYTLDTAEEGRWSQTSLGFVLVYEQGSRKSCETTKRGIRVANFTMLLGLFCCSNSLQASVAYNRSAGSSPSTFITATTKDLTRSKLRREDSFWLKICDIHGEEIMVAGTWGMWLSSQSGKQERWMLVFTAVISLLFSPGLHPWNCTSHILGESSHFN